MHSRFSSVHTGTFYMLNITFVYKAEYTRSFLIFHGGNFFSSISSDNFFLLHHDWCGNSLEFFVNERFITFLRLRLFVCLPCISSFDFIPERFPVIILVFLSLFCFPFTREFISFHSKWFRVETTKIVVHLAIISVG